MRPHDHSDPILEQFPVPRRELPRVVIPDPLAAPRAKVAVLAQPEKRGPFGLLLDPHTGIPLPREAAIRATAGYASLPFIVEADRELRPKYMICFDQSYHRKHDVDKKEQRAEKMKFLHKEGLVSFYYASHAPFLFVAREPSVLHSIRARLLTLGIPAGRLESET